MSNALITKGFILSGLVNTVGVMIFSKCYTNEILNQADPAVMSNFGLIMIGVWGLLFFSVAKTYHLTPWLVLVFAIEKLVYSVTWLFWMSNNYSNLGALYEQDLLAGMFYSVYGINDILFMMFFLGVFIHLKGENSS